MTHHAAAAHDQRAASRPGPVHRTLAVETVPPIAGPEPRCADREALDACRLNLRVLHEVAAPELAVRMLGLDLAMPVLGSPLDCAGFNEGPGTALTEALVGGLADAGLASATGDAEADWAHEAGLAALRRVHGRGLAMFLPWDENDLLRRIERAEQAGCAAVGLDAGAVAPTLLGRGARHAGSRSPSRLARIIRHTALPFVVSGVMTPDEAQLAVDAGASAVAVSGRRWRDGGHVPGVAEVMPWIVEAVGGQCEILADGGARCGADVLKLLALGARGVMVGLPFVQAAWAGREAVAGAAKRFLDELAQAMILTGTASARSVSRGVLYVRR